MIQFIRSGNLRDIQRLGTQAGDAFMAALVRAYAEQLPLEDAARYASAAASIATESITTINPALSAEAVRSRVKDHPLAALDL